MISAASFRDPAGRVFLTEDSVFRVLGRSAYEDLHQFLELPAAEALASGGDIPGTRVCAHADVPDAIAHALGDDACVVQHERVWFPSYPYEWAPEMLHAAGSLTISLARRVLSAGWGLKDASPYNVLFDGPRPVFVDHLSFERRHAGDPVWLPNAQFERNFLIPLLVNRHTGLDLRQIFLARRDGVEPQEALRMLSLTSKLSPKTLGVVTLPALLGRKGASNGTYKPVVRKPDEAEFILDTLLRRSARLLDALAPRAARNGHWSAYMKGASSCSYNPADFSIKETLVREAFELAAARSVLDVGCNTGHFSAAAAAAGAKHVLSIDSDPAVIGQLWKRAQSDKLPILPLVVDLSRPSPATGWLNRECPSFLDRARGRFDMVCFLALIHHLLVTERVPLPDIMAMGADLTRRWLLVEFIERTDPMFAGLVRGREALYEYVNREVFEAACRPHFRTVRCSRVGGAERWLYLLEKL